MLASLFFKGGGGGGGDVQQTPSIKLIWKLVLKLHSVSSVKRIDQSKAGSSFLNLFC